MKTSGFVFLLFVIILYLFPLASSEIKLGLEDYTIPMDPSPTSRKDWDAKAGPIEHGTPLNPYVVPKPPPPPPPQSQDGG